MAGMQQACTNFLNESRQFFRFEACLIEEKVKTSNQKQDKPNPKINARSSCCSCHVRQPKQKVTTTQDIGVLDGSKSHSEKLTILKTTYFYHRYLTDTE